MTRASTLPSTLVVLDVETTGTNPFVHDLVSLAFVPVRDGIPALSVMVRPARPVWSSYASANFRRFEDDWHRNAISPREAAIEIEHYLGRICNGGSATLVGHNIAFDLAFLRKLAFECGKDDLLGAAHRSIDTHSLIFLAWMLGKAPETALTSDGAFDFFGISIPSQARHTALGDALATKSLFLRVCALLGHEPDGAAPELRARWLTER